MPCLPQQLRLLGDKEKSPFPPAVHDTSPCGEDRSPLPGEANVSNASYGHRDSHLRHWPFGMEMRQPVFLILIPQKNIRHVLNHTHQSWTPQALESTELRCPGGYSLASWLQCSLHLETFSQTLSPHMLPLSGEMHPENPASQRPCPSRARHFCRNSWLRKTVTIFMYPKIDCIIPCLSSIHFKIKF